jgi:hypothetical protein
LTLLKGALLSFTPTFLTPVPNAIVFQFNPETMTHTWSQPDRGGQAAVTPNRESGNPLAVPGMPGEEFQLTIVVDSNQDIADQVPVGAQLAQVSGVYTRLAALEMLLHPISGDPVSQLLGQASAAISQAASGLTGSGCKTDVPDSTVPVVLFVWGLFRIVPVRVTGLTITEKLYDEELNPVNAEAQLQMRVLTPEELQAARESNEVLGALATVAYTYTLGIRQLEALANLGEVGLAAIGIH